PRAPTYLAGLQRTLQPSRTPSTRGHERFSDGELPPKLWTSIYSHYKRRILRRPIESALTACVRGADQRFRLDRVSLAVPLPQRHPQRRHHQICGHGGRCIPGNDALGEHVDDERDVGEAGHLLAYGHES